MESKRQNRSNGIEATKSKRRNRSAEIEVTKSKQRNRSEGIEATAGEARRGTCFERGIGKKQEGKRGKGREEGGKGMGIGKTGST